MQHFERNITLNITSVRLGFATNSSSAHSVVFGGSFGGWSKQEIAEKYSGYGQDEFGWEFDEYSDLDSLVNYGLLLFDIYNLENVSEELQTILDKAKAASVEGYIDHQSMPYESYDYDDFNGTAEENFWKFISEVSEVSTGNDNV